MGIVINLAQVFAAFPAQCRFLTSRILDLIERGMLVGDPMKRVKSKTVCLELARILEDSQSSHAVDPPLKFVRALREMDEDTSSSISIPISTPNNATQGECLLISKKRQAANSTLLELPTIKTAHDLEIEKLSQVVRPIRARALRPTHNSHRL